ncbi:Fe-S-cluster containining protein [Bradyrhizobium sp. LM3.2]
MGYILEKGFDLPPLMLTPEEIEAAVLGAQWVAGHADPALARAAEDLMAKIADTVPERLRPFVLEPASRARPSWNREPDRLDMVRTRTQIHEGRKIMLRYRDEQGRASERMIWPISVGYLEAVRLLAAWCELRGDFRSFRTDRVVDASYLEDRYPERRDVLRAKWPAEPGLGSAKGHVTTMDENSPIDLSNCCQSCGACCGYSANWPRFSIESDEELAAIPETLVNDRQSGMRCEGDRCSALQGEIGKQTACGIYQVRPEVCRTCMPGDAECAMARRKFGLPIITNA